MPAPRVCILRVAGTNCDVETQYAWELAGAHAERIHIRRLIERPALLDACAALTLPGGFSYGDDISAGRIFAAQVQRHLLDAVVGFIDRGGLVLGVCNGFQVLVKTGLLPFPGETGGPRRCSVTYNQPRGFQDRWVTLAAGDHECAFLEPGRRYELPIAHGEGRVVFSDEPALRRVTDAGLDVLRYVPSEAVPSDEPFNPNGSQADVAGLCDPTGRVFGLMPHPERFVVATQHPRWTARGGDARSDGLAIFRRAVACMAPGRALATTSE
ncbi:MAG: phosphoribosylformylglycinamidine synthase I [Phycisphaerae bacterium]|nr:phosphoribosylformylglycinamidine synthase I [Phycisphaerae bacterium]MCZ2399650.1 phosphoribosylformylglycinamidine synthase I [Phycisphaerae bacterium]NUQ49521.1 phosphoribosylformylglycinamidine synthase I [Phycisphaerae bacterium]